MRDLGEKRAVWHGNNVANGLRYCDGEFTAYDDPDAGKSSGQGTQLAKINADGDIAGWYTDSHNLDHGFLLHPARPCSRERLRRTT